MNKAIANCKIYTGKDVIEDKVILVKDGVVVSVQSYIPDEYTVIDLQDKSIAPGLIDIQVNGGEQIYFSQYPDERALFDMSVACRKYGTCFFLPTLISSPQKKILDAIDNVRDFIRQYPDKGVLGMHLEGPFISPEKRGTHSVHTVRKATDREIEEIAFYGKGIVKIMTIAPEMMTDVQMEILQKNGIILSIGHSNINYEDAQRYFDTGIRLVTHLYNAMSDFSHRAPNLVGAALDNDSVYTPLILDGHHSHFSAGRIAQKIKRDKLILTTDCAFLGRKMESFAWEDFEAFLDNDSYVNKEGHLAGSAISMAEAVSNAINYLQVSTQEAIEMATSRVARALNSEDRIGFIQQGFPASFFVFEEDDVMQGQSLIF